MNWRLIARHLELRIASNAATYASQGWPMDEAYLTTHHKLARVWGKIQNREYRKQGLYQIYKGIK